MIKIFIIKYQKVFTDNGVIYYSDDQNLTIRNCHKMQKNNIGNIDHHIYEMVLNSCDFSTATNGKI